MTHITYLIIGGGIAGTTAAETIRQHDKGARITIISDEPHRLYSRIMLSKQNFFLGKLPLDSIWLKTEDWYAKNSISIISGKKAVALDPAQKMVTLNDGTVISYEKLLLAIGGEPRHITVPGQEPDDILYLRRLDEATRIIDATKHSQKGIAIGGGFISFEICELMRLSKMAVTLVLREARFWETIFDETGSSLIEAAIAKGGASIIRNASCKEIRHIGSGKELVLSDGSHIPFDMIVAGIGIAVEHDWVTSAGLETRFGIVANEYLETRDPSIWVAGDAAEYYDSIVQEYVQMGNWTNAQIQGRIAGNNMAGIKTPMHFVSSYTTFGFGIRIAFVGNVRDGKTETVTRFDAGSGGYARFFLKDGRAIGAALINRTQDIGAISKLIEKKVDLADFKSHLTDPTMPLQKLLET